jgi:hypothetical protein
MHTRMSPVEVGLQQCDWCGRKGEPREYTICKGGASTWAILNFVTCASCC